MQAMFDKIQLLKALAVIAIVGSTALITALFIIRLEVFGKNFLAK